MILQSPLNGLFSVIPVGSSAFLHIFHFGTISKGFASAAGPVACSLLNSCKVAGYLGGVFLERNFGVFGSAAKKQIEAKLSGTFFQTIYG